MFRPRRSSFQTTSLSEPRELAAQTGYGRAVRDCETIESELRLVAPVRWSIREHGVRPSSEHIDALLDERGSSCMCTANEWLDGHDT